MMSGHVIVWTQTLRFQVNHKIYIYLSISYLNMISITMITTGIHF